MQGERESAINFGGIWGQGKFQGLPIAGNEGLRGFGELFGTVVIFEGHVEGGRCGGFQPEQAFIGFFFGEVHAPSIEAFVFDADLSGAAGEDEPLALPTEETVGFDG